MPSIILGFREGVSRGHVLEAIGAVTALCGLVPNRGWATVTAQNSVDLLSLSNICDECQRLATMTTARLP